METSAEIAALVAQGRQLQRARRFAEALDCFDKALAANPDLMEALGNRGNVLGTLGRHAEALADYDRALRLSPGHAVLLYNRGTVLRQLGRPVDALDSYDQALKFNPDAPEIWANRGIALRDLKHFDEALESYGHAIRLRPDYAKALYNRGNVMWVDRKQIAPALADFERAFAADPDTDNLAGDLLHLRMHVADWRDFEQQKNHIDAGVRAGRRMVGPFAYQAISGSPADLQACAMIYANDCYPAQRRQPPAPYRHQKIRIGYLCGEFRQQATSFLTAGLFEQHDKSRFEIIAFDNGWSDHSPLRRRLEAAFDKVRDIARLSHVEAAEAIRDEEVDILVNLNGYFGEHRMTACAFRPAPVQVNYLGFPGTLGAGYMDYILADSIVIPEDERQFYSEQVITLPDTYQSTDSRRGLDEAMSRDACGLPENAFVFCNFNQSYKLTPDIFAGWMRILKQVPGSVLWLLESNEQFPGNIRREAEKAGVDAARIIFAPMIGAQEHLARLRQADLFLDTLPYNAHTTASDALWAGVPLITRMGSAFPGRVAASLLHAIGLPELITRDAPSYEALAVALARNPERLASVRRKLQDNRLTRPLFDTARFCRALEAAFTRMWQISEAGEPPRAFAVVPED